MRGLQASVTDKSLATGWYDLEAAGRALACGETLRLTMAEPVAVAVAASSFQAILQRLFDLVAAFRTAVKAVETAPGKTKELADLVDRAATILKSLEKVEGYEELLTPHVTALGEQLLLALEEVQNDEQRKKNGQVVAVAKALFHHGASKQNKGSMAIIQFRIRELMVDVSQAVCVIALLRTLPPVHHQAIARDELARRRDSFPEYIHSWGEVRNEVGGMVLPDGADSAKSLLNGKEKWTPLEVEEEDCHPCSSVKEGGKRGLALLISMEKYSTKSGNREGGSVDRERQPWLYCSSHGGLHSRRVAGGGDGDCENRCSWKG